MLFRNIVQLILVLGSSHAFIAPSSVKSLPTAVMNGNLFLSKLEAAKGFGEKKATTPPAKKKASSQGTVQSAPQESSTVEIITSPTP